MLSVFIFKSNTSGMQYGMGTYIRELTDALLAYTDIKVYIVAYHNTEYKEFKIEIISSRYFKINIPAPRQHSTQNNSNLHDRRCASAIVNLLSDVIPKNEEVIFQINSMDGLNIIKKLKERYLYPVISIVHFALWQQLFKGNKQKLTELNIDNHSTINEYYLSHEKEMYQISDHIISVTGYMKEFLVNHYLINQEKIDIIPNGLNYSNHHCISKKEKIKLKHDLGFRVDEKIILFTGRVDPDKGINFLLEAFTEICKHVDNLRLVIVGSGIINDCMKKYQHFYGKITFTEFVSSEQIKQFYQIADIGVVPSIYDHCPYTVLEMMAYKIPLIMSKIEGLDEILNESECIYLIPEIEGNGNIKLNIKEISNAITYLLEDQLKRTVLGKRSKKLIVSKFSAKRMAKDTIRVFHNLLPKQNEVIKE